MLGVRNGAAILKQVAPVAVLTGIEWGAQALGPVLFWAQKSTKKCPAQGPIKITSKREIL